MRTIRTATLADLDSISAVGAECFPPAEAADAKQSSDRLVAFVDGFVTSKRDLTDDMYENGKWTHQELQRYCSLF